LEKGLSNCNQVKDPERRNLSQCLAEEVKMADTNTEKRQPKTRVIWDHSCVRSLRNWEEARGRFPSRVPRKIMQILVHANFRH
jgi:hypothetical protein